MRRCCPCSQVPGFGSLPRSSLNLILQFEACRQLFNTKSQAVIFSLRATIPFTSQMPNYSLHLISVPQGDSCQGRAASSFKIGYIRLTAIKFGAGRVMARELDRNNFLFNPSSNSQAQSSQTGALWMYHTPTKSSQAARYFREFPEEEAYPLPEAMKWHLNHQLNV